MSESGDEDAGRDGDVTLHIPASEVQDGDRILDPPEELGQESVTVRGVRHRTGFGGRLVQVTSRAGSFPLGASTMVTVRRPQ